SDLKETPRDQAFCAHAINYPDELFLVPDARIDERFKDNPLVVEDPNLVFYAGIPLVDNEGFALGSLCVIDHKPKELSEGQVSSLRALSHQVMKLIQLRKSEARLQNLIKQLEQRNAELEEFAYIAAHDIKSPIHNINSLAGLFLHDYADGIDKDGLKVIEMIRKSIRRLSQMIDNLLEYRRSEKVLEEPYTTINLRGLMSSIREILVLPKNTKVKLSTELRTIDSKRTALTQILVNLITNAIKYNDKPKPLVTVYVAEQEHYYQLQVKDNGPGIPATEHGNIFEIFRIAASADKNGIRGSGIGLATVKKLVESLAGNIELESEEGKGTTFTFTVRKKPL
ncbi:MAG: GAF domain-containing sensor histidine kinase, partial [Cyclobacteriaceae bacterium]